MRNISRIKMIQKISSTILSLPEFYATEVNTLVFAGKRVSNPMVFILIDEVLFETSYWILKCVLK